MDIIFEQQRDKEANYMAAFTAKDPDNRTAFDIHWQKIRSDENIVIRTILYKRKVAGFILHHDWFDIPEVSYWIGKAFWGMGVATQSLRLFLIEIDIRPLYAHVAADNLASIRVLEKCGFIKIAEDSGYANARGEKIAELILKLEKEKVEEEK